MRFGTCCSNVLELFCQEEWTKTVVSNPKNLLPEVHWRCSCRVHQMVKKKKKEKKPNKIYLNSRLSHNRMWKSPRGVNTYASTDWVQAHAWVRMLHSLMGIFQVWLNTGNSLGSFNGNYGVCVWNTSEWVLLISDTAREQCILLILIIPRDLFCVKFCFSICQHPPKTTCLLHCFNQVCVCICGVAIPTQLYSSKIIYGLYLQFWVIALKE